MTNGCADFFGVSEEQVKSVEKWLEGLYKVIPSRERIPESEIKAHSLVFFGAMEAYKPTFFETFGENALFDETYTPLVREMAEVLSLQAKALRCEGKVESLDYVRQIIPKQSAARKFTALPYAAVSGDKSELNFEVWGYLWDISGVSSDLETSLSSKGYSSFKLCNAIGDIGPIKDFFTDRYERLRQKLPLLEGEAKSLAYEVFAEHLEINEILVGPAFAKQSHSEFENLI